MRFWSKPDFSWNAGMHSVACRGRLCSTALLRRKTQHCHESNGTR